MPPYAIYAGNPARFIKKRFDDSTIKRLLNIKWWDWPDQKKEKVMPYMLDNDIEKFLDYAEKRMETKT
jgi:virginiamycin A acetyltransferase